MTKKQKQPTQVPKQDHSKIKKEKKLNPKQSKKSSKKVLDTTVLPKQEVPSIIGKPWSEIQVQIREQIITSLMKNNFTTMFPVQQAAIPLLLKNYDLAVEAQTGSGKTLSFLIPLLQKYLVLNDPCKTFNEGQAESSRITIKFLLISPTRQLCQQSYFTLQRLLDQLPNPERTEAYKKYCLCATGGSSLDQDLKRINDGVYVLFGTVGRLREIGQQVGENWLKKVQYLFVDEADRVLKEKGIDELIKSVQKLRRTAMFSATLQGMQQKNFNFSV